MASTVSLNRGDGNWVNGYRYMVSPDQGQTSTSFVQLPITESETMGAVQDFTVSYTGVTNTASFGNPYAPCVPNTSQVLQPKTDGTLTTPTQDYYPAYTEVQTAYGYNNLEHYGTTNVGKAVAMSLASMENCNAMGQVQDSRLSDVCQSILPNNSTMVNSNGEFLFNEFLGGESDLLEVCKQNDGTTSNYYKMQSINAPSRDGEEHRSDSLIGAEFPMGGDNIYINIDNTRKDDGSGTCGDASTYNASTGQTISSVQKKYKFYGKGRPYDLEEDKVETTREQYDHTTYIPESHYQRSSVGETSQQYSYPNELHLLNTVNRTITYGTPETAGNSSRDLASATNFQFPSGSSYYPTVFHEDMSEDSDSRTGSCKSDDRVSKDEKRAKELKIPLTTYEIISLPIDEFNEKLSKFELTDPQLSLIRDIRRRGKNKVAAQNCRKRKLDQIYTLQHEVQNLHLEKARLETQQDTLFKRRMLLNEKYIYVFQLINNFNKTDTSQPTIPQEQPLSQQYQM